MEGGDKRGYKKLQRKYKRLLKRAGGCLFFADKGVWQPRELPNNRYLNDFCAFGAAEVLVAGSGGTLLRVLTLDRRHFGIFRSRRGQALDLLP